jgi:hypothetical protein
MQPQVAVGEGILNLNELERTATERALRMAKGVQKDEAPQK